ncbi:MAG: response regulator [Kiritimatiellaeota bacterium]|nr:response regulator [Kiritimatiellota bacterium]
MASKQIQVLLLEDQGNERLLLRSLLMFGETFRADVTEAGSAEEAERLLATRRFDVIFLSADLQGGNGLRWLPELVGGGFAPVIVLARNSNERLAVTAIKGGALDYYPKNQVSAQILDDLLAEAVQAAGRSGTGPGALQDGGGVGRSLSLDRIRAFGGNGAQRTTAPADTGPTATAFGTVPFRAPPPPPAPTPQTGAAAFAQPAREEYPVPSGPTAPGQEEVPAATVNTADPAAQPKSKGISYQTAGIDRVMESFGLRRAPSLVDNLPQFWTELGEILKQVAAAPDPEQYETITDMAKRLTEMVHKDFEIVPVLQTAYPEEKLIVGHSLNTAMLSIVLSRCCQYAEEDTATLAVAALLHDAATFQPEAAAEIDPGEKAVFAAEAARKIGAPETVVQALQQFPEHADGSGPLALNAKEIVIDAQVLLLANCFEHLYYHRWKRFAGTTIGELAQKEAGSVVVDPINLIVHGLRSWFQPRVLKALIFTTGFYSTGSIVELNNGAVARVVSQNRNKPTLPIVEVISTSLGEKPPKPLRLDLAETRGISIRKTLSYNPPGNS